MLFLSHTEYFRFLLPILALAILGAFWYGKRRRGALKGYPALAANCYSFPAEVTRTVLLLLALISAGMIALGPMYEREVAHPTYEGLEIAVAIDCSRSMLAPIGGADYTTSRMTVVREALDKSIQALPLDDWGIACFAGKLLGVAPLTKDYVRFLKPKLDDIADPQYLQVVGDGTNFGAALNGCKTIWRLDTPAKKICVIISDGEPQGDMGKLQLDLTKSTLALQSEIRARDLSTAFYVVGVGDPTEAVRIPKYDSNGNPESFLSDNKSGEPFLTRPSAEYLEHIAETFDGTYRHLNKGEQLNVMLADIINSERRKTGERNEMVRTDISFPIALFMIFCLCIFHWFPKTVHALFRVSRKKK